MPGFIYFIRSGAHGAIKVGYATNVATRIASLQIGNPMKLHLLGCIAGPQSIETKILRDLKPWRLSGEWHTPARAVSDYINNRLATEGIKGRAGKQPKFKFTKNLAMGRQLEQEQEETESAARKSRERAQKWADWRAAVGSETAATLRQKMISERDSRLENFDQGIALFRQREQAANAPTNSSHSDSKYSKMPRNLLKTGTIAVPRSI
jgi:hypothetical protein